MKLITKAEIDPKSLKAWLIEHIELETGKKVEDIEFKMIHPLGSKPQLDGVAVRFRVDA
jgi:hypothetical protein